MTRDFTYDIYEELLEAGLKAGYEHLTVRQYLSDEELPDRFVIHRHDVDRKPENSLEMAEVEAKHGISTTYYFRTIDKTFKPTIIQEIEDLGHEIGYHYEDLDRTSGDVQEAHESFDKHLSKLRRYSDVDTICMHGNPLTRHDNRDMWTSNRSFKDYGLLGEAYLSMDFEDVTYYSDTGRTWEDGALKIKDHTMGEGTKRVSARSTRDLKDILMHDKVARACLLSHPNRWAGSFPEHLIETSKDTVINSIKRVLNMVK